ncbi:glycosyltransferase family 2 protein [Bradyrhizobium sp.]|uniref:glycosyltransferase family 2 protein n=1 Tax=Bradyrhizobium sp. TaxID=376 RepID=UPI0027347497|nr:glycosyltransferase family 2 protein [Bradyrhizobium sp.]MDP3075373.1 glycosyltransferase family 2 protein [Bradyrhizobium sp.]
MAAYCIIVGYRPEVVQLFDLCARVEEDGIKVIVVDNSEAPTLDPGALPAGCTLITIGYNSGIAHAQNVGVAAALTAGATVLVFFDQDQKIGPGFGRSLIAAVSEGSAEIVSPLSVDEATNMPLPSLRISRFGWSTPVHSADSADRYPVDMVISSGTAATRQVFETAGTFDDGLFIDLVDVEWCLRCRARQIPIYVVPSLVMRHSVGLRHFRFGTLTISVHSPMRCYYQIRNGFLLFRKPHIPLIFALKQLVATLLSRMILLFFVEDRLSYLKSYLFAVRDGLKGVTGARPA